jgi:hypothetical protein
MICMCSPLTTVLKISWEVNFKSIHIRMHKHTQKYFWVPVFLLYKLKALIICKKVGSAALQATVNTDMLKASRQQTLWFFYHERTDSAKQI